LQTNERVINTHDELSSSCEGDFTQNPECNIDHDINNDDISLVESKPVHKVGQDDKSRNKPCPNKTKSVGKRTDFEEKDKEHGVLRVIATCSGNHVTLYEVQSQPMANKPHEASKGPLKVRQAYVDSDAEEIFYTCAFGGRGANLQKFILEQRAALSSALTDHFVKEKLESKDQVVLSSKQPSPLTKRQRTEGSFAGSSLPATEGFSKCDNIPQMHSQNILSDKKITCRVKHQITKNFYQFLGNFYCFDGPQLLCCAGKRGVIKVIDTTRKALILTLSGHGDEVYDMKFSPIDEWLLLTASKDESIRLWNLQSATCVAIFAGHNGHRDSVLAVDFHPLGNMFVSAGMDTTIKLWNLDNEVVSQAIIQSRERKYLSGQNVHDSKDIKSQNETEQHYNSVFKTRFEQIPCFSTKQVHTDYVDCVQFMGNLVLSKSISNAIVLWKPDLSDAKCGYICDKVIALREFHINQCESWFIRFHTFNFMLAVGNNIGEIKIWKICSSPQKRHFANLTHQHCTSTIRMVSFSPDGNSLVAVCDDATIWKWDTN